MTRKPEYRGDWPRIAAAQIAAHPQCAWCGATTDLCADHIIRRKPQYGLRTLCRTCNSRRSQGWAGPKGQGPPNL